MVVEIQKAWQKAVMWQRLLPAKMLESIVAIVGISLRAQLSCSNVPSSINNSDKSTCYEFWAKHSRNKQDQTFNNSTKSAPYKCSHSSSAKKPARNDFDMLSSPIQVERQSVIQLTHRGAHVSSKQSSGSESWNSLKSSF